MHEKWMHGCCWNCALASAHCKFSLFFIARFCQLSILAMPEFTGQTDRAYVIQHRYTVATISTKVFYLASPTSFFVWSMLHRLKTSSQYDAGAMSIAEQTNVPGQNAALNVQKFNSLIGWMLATLHSRRWSRNQFYSSVTLTTQYWCHYCEL